MTINLEQPDTHDLVLAIDIGSSSLRTNLFTCDARRLVEYDSDLEYPTHATPDGGAEIDPHGLLESLFAAIDSTLERAEEHAGRIRGVGMCSLVSNVMGVDAASRPTTPIYTWADTQCADDASDLRAALDDAEIHERTGCHIHASYLPARLLWLKRAHPETYARTVMWISLGDWVQMQLFGRAAQSLSVASWSGLLNRHTLDWDGDLLAFLGIGRDHLPPLVDAGDALSGLRQEYARRWPALENVPWFPCIGDGAAGNVGCGCYGPNELTVQVGTSGAIRSLVPGPPGKLPAGLWCYRLDRHTALLGGALSEGGNVLSWLQEAFVAGGKEEFEQFEEAAASLPPDSHGLTVLPFWQGERSPGWNGKARATVHGLALSTAPAEVYRAAQEAITYRFAILYELMQQVLAPARMIVGAGGALLNVQGWVQMLADVLGQPVAASAESQASSKGAAMVVLRSLGLISDFEEIPAALADLYSPDMTSHRVYRHGIERQRELYDLLRPLRDR